MGRVVMIRPVSHSVLTAVAAFIGVVLISVLTLFDYTRRTEVTGVLEPSKGIIKLSTPQPGRLSKVFHREGDHVRKGDILMIFSAEHALPDGRIVEANEEEELRQRLQSLESEYIASNALEKAEAASQQRYLDTLLESKANLSAQIETQKLRIKSSEQSLRRYDELYDAGYFSALQLQAKREELLDQKIRLQAAESQLFTNAAETAKTNHLISTSTLKHSQTLAQYTRSTSSLRSELNRMMGMHGWSIDAPCDGTISAVSIHQGQLIPSTAPIMTIVPAGENLQADLYVPSRALGFLKPGQRVNVKLDAFPYQKFGMLTGRVHELSGTPALPSEIASSTRLLPSGIADEPMYSLKVKLDRQSIQAYGLQQILRPGIQVSAEIELDSRKLYEWILEPLYR